MNQKLKNTLCLSVLMLHLSLGTASLAAANDSLFADEVSGVESSQHPQCPPGAHACKNDQTVTCCESHTHGEQPLPLPITPQRAEPSAEECSVCFSEPRPSAFCVQSCHCTSAFCGAW